MQDGGSTSLASGATLTVTGAVAENGGTISLGDSNGGANLSALPGGTQVGGGAILTGYGSITGDVTNSGEVDVGSSITPPQLLSLAGNYTELGGTTNVYGQLQATGNVAQGGGVMNISLSSSILTTDGKYTVTGGSVSDAGALNVGGLLEQDGGALGASTGSSLTAGTVLLTGGDMHLTWNTLQVNGNFTVTGGTGMLVYGTATVGGQMLLQGGVFTLYNPTTAVTGGVLIDTGGELDFEWRDVITYNVTNRGILRMLGNGTMSGDYTQTPSGTLIIESTGIGVYSTLSVGGTATLAGTFVLDMQGQYPSGLPYAVLYYGQVSGTFDTWDLPPPPVERDLGPALQRPELPQRPQPLGGGPMELTPYAEGDGASHPAARGGFWHSPHAPGPLPPGPLSSDAAGAGKRPRGYLAWRWLLCLSSTSPAEATAPIRGGTAPAGSAAGSQRPEAAPFHLRPAREFRRRSGSPPLSYLLPLPKSFLV